MSNGNRKENSDVRIYRTDEYENKDKKKEFQTSDEFKEEELKNEDVFNDNYKNPNSNLVKQLDEFKDFNFEYNNKIKTIDEYIKKYIYPKIKFIYEFFKNKLNNENFNKNDYSFKFLIKNMDKKLKAINIFFNVFDFIKKKLYIIDYNLFIKKFIESLKTIEGEADIFKPEKLVNIWKFINNIYMMKIYYNIIENIKSENFSILNENNNLCKEMLFSIINPDFFEGEYFLGLFDYIYFEDRFILEETEDKENRKDNSVNYKKFINFHDKLHFLNENSYFYLYKSIKAKNVAKQNIISNWNKYIIEEYKNNKLNLIYQIFNYYNHNKLNCRKNFYLKIFNMIINKKEYLDNIHFINSLIAIIAEDKCNIFEIYSNEIKKTNDYTNEKEEEKKVDEKLEDQENDDNNEKENNEKKI